MKVGGLTKPGSHRSLRNTSMKWDSPHPPDSRVGNDFRSQTEKVALVQRHFVSGLPPGWTARPIESSEDTRGRPIYVVADAGNGFVDACWPDDMIPERRHKEYLWRRFDERRRNERKLNEGVDLHVHHH